MTQPAALLLPSPISATIEPLHKEPESTTPAKPTFTTQKELHDYLDEQRKKGFDEGAVVCRASEKWGITNPKQWGVINVVQTWLSQNKDYSPFRVLFYDNSTGYAYGKKKKTEDELWPEELYLIYPSYKKDLSQPEFRRKVEESNSQVIEEEECHYYGY